MNYVPDEVREIQHEQGWTDETLLDLVFQGMSPDEVSRVVERLDAIAEDENDECIESDDEAEDDELLEPEEEDLITTDHVRFSHYSDAGPIHAFDVPDGGDWRKHARDWMSKNNFFPNVWFISDHGNAHILSLDDPDAND